MQNQCFQLLLDIKIVKPLYYVRAVRLEGSPPSAVRRTATDGRDLSTLFLLVNCLSVCHTDESQPRLSAKQQNHYNCHKPRTRESTESILTKTEWDKGFSFSEKHLNSRNKLKSCNTMESKDIMFSLLHDLYVPMA